MANTPASATKEKPAGTPKKAAGTTPKAAAAVRAPKQQTPAERIQALEHEIARIRRDEHDSRYHLITETVAELNAMGYQYRLVDDSKAGARGTKKSGAASDGPAAAPVAAPGGGSELSAHYDEKKYCKLCKDTGHDQKAHKGEWQNKAFTNEEKARRGVLPPELLEAFVAEHQPQH